MRDQQTESARTQPVEIHLDRSKELRIRWADGVESVLPLAVVRKACPCATCRERRAPERPPHGGLPILHGPEAAGMAVAEDAQLVGNYALRVRWADGHDAGIYDYGLLRSLDPALSEGLREPGGA